MPVEGVGEARAGVALAFGRAVNARARRFWAAMAVRVDDQRVGLELAAIAKGRAGRAWAAWILVEARLAENTDGGDRLDGDGDR